MVESRERCSRIGSCGSCFGGEVGVVCAVELAIGVSIPRLNPVNVYWRVGRVKSVGEKEKRKGGERRSFSSLCAIV